MSTRGSFIIRKNRTDKELQICHDAYPDGAGLDITELIKAVDVNVLYDLIADYEEECWAADINTAPDFPDEPEEFSLERCKRAVRDRNIVYGTVSGDLLEKETISCEYTYIIDLDAEMLQVYAMGGEKIKCSEESKYIPFKYGNILKAAFELDYIRRIRAERVAERMNAAVKADGDHVMLFRTEDILSEDEIPADYSEQKQRAATILMDVIGRLNTTNSRIPTLEPVCKRRADDIVYGCGLVSKAVRELEKIVELT
ncbi:MAG: hypothetical protein IJ719_21200 [Clostridia bacterium]|nr:hypothetical protein [Clostridia bacterium]